MDSQTKRRQYVAIAIALVSLVLTMALYFRGAGWLVPSLMSYVALGGIIYWGNKQVRLVPFNDSESDA